MAIEVSLKELIEAGAHYGHQARRWNPKMAPFIYTQKDGVHVFDLTITKEKLEEALDQLKKASKEGKKIIFLGTKKQAVDKVEEVATETDSYYVTERWLGGTLTNFSQIKKSTKKLEDLKKSMADGEFKKRTKKERLLIEREIERLERFFGGIVGMEEIPEVMVIVDTKRESGALQEAAQEDITTIAIVDSNADPSLVDYPIPMNDDASKGLEYVLDLMKQAILEGKGKKQAVNSGTKKSTTSSNKKTEKSKSKAKKSSNK